MDNTKKIIIACLIGIIIVLSGAILGGFLKEPVKTVELFENGTTVEVPSSTNLTSHDEFSTIYVTGKNTTIIGINNNNLAGALASKILSQLIVEKGEKQDNGLYALDETSIMELADQLGQGYDNKNIKEVKIAIKHNNTVNQSVIIIGSDEQEIINILESIQWKQGVHSDTQDGSESEVQSSFESGDDKTFPLYADDGTIIGYYHVGDVVEHYDGLYQLQSNGEWVCIGEAKGSSQNAYSRGYSDAMDDSSNKNPDSGDSYDSDWENDDNFDEEYSDSEL